MTGNTLCFMSSEIGVGDALTKTSHHILQIS